MQINNLIIKNFKAFKEAHVNFGDLTLITGPNSSGKSSIVHALLLMKQSIVEYGDSVSIQDLKVNGPYINLQRAKDLLNFQIGDSEELSLQLRSLQLGDYFIEKTFKFEGSNDKLGYRPAKFHGEDNPTIKPDLPHIGGIILGDETTAGDLERPFAEIFNVNLNVYLNSYRIKPEKSYDNQDSYHGLKFTPDGSNVPFYLASKGDDPVLNDKVNELDLKSIRECVQAWMSQLSSGEVGSGDLRIKTTDIPAINATVLQYQFNRNDGLFTDPMSPFNVGFGLTNVLPVVTALVSAEPGSIVIIENPEAHLHPKAQAVIGKLAFLAALGGVQVILETHSDHIMNGVRVAVKQHYDFNKEDVSDKVSTLYVSYDSDEKQSVINNIMLDKSGRFDHWPEGFFDEWDIQIMNLL